VSKVAASASLRLSLARCAIRAISCELRAMM
jgi:hypothetical protein